LQVVATLQATIAARGAAIVDALAPYRAAVDHLVTIPGVSTTAAQILVAEIGPGRLAPSRSASSRAEFRALGFTGDLRAPWR
jgi:transposase